MVLHRPVELHDLWGPSNLGPLTQTIRLLLTFVFSRVQVPAMSPASKSRLATMATFLLFASVGDAAGQSRVVAEQRTRSRANRVGTDRRVLVTATVAAEFHVKDIDGKQPMSLTLENA